MKNNICCIILLITIMIGCKKKEDLIEIAPNPDPGPVSLTKAGEFIKSLKVAGATEVKFDSLSNSYVVTMPDNFTAEKAEVLLGMQPKIFLSDSSGKASPDTVIRYAFRGESPMDFSLMDEKNTNRFHFMVYFNFKGRPDIELLKNEIPINSNGIQVPIRFLARVGTLPSVPMDGGARVRFLSRKTGFSADAVLYDLNATFLFSSASRFISDGPFALEVKLVDQPPVVFENIRFTRGVPNAAIYPSYEFQHKRTDSVHVYGGFYLPEEKYTITFSSDNMVAPVSVPMVVKDSSHIALEKIPSTLADGSYLLSFYEKDKLIGNGHIYLGDAPAKSIETIWKGALQQSTTRNTERVVLKKGDDFYAKPSPIVYAYRESDINLNNIPKLHLVSSARTVDLTPGLASFHWGIAGIYLVFGKYKIPADLPAGSYTVTAIFPDGTQSKSYWSRIAVQ
ncbi:hypothetical protein [Dyadobacter beijingensis]|nr:hypothetical protein [Dyadobacter beijingensis]